MPVLILHDALKRGITLFKNLKKYDTSVSAGDVCYKVFTGVKICSQNMNKSTLHWHHRCPAGLATVVLCKNSTAWGSAESSLSLYGEMCSWGDERCDCSWVPWANGPEPTVLHLHSLSTNKQTNNKKNSFGQQT